MTSPEGLGGEGNPTQRLQWISLKGLFMQIYPFKHGFFMTLFLKSAMLTTQVQLQDFQWFISLADEHYKLDLLGWLSTLSPIHSHLTRRRENFEAGVSKEYNFY